MDDVQAYEQSQSLIKHPYIVRHFDTYLATTYYFKIRNAGMFKIVKMHGNDVYHIYRIMASGVPEFIQNVQTPKDVIEFVNKL